MKRIIVFAIALIAIPFWVNQTSAQFPSRVKAQVALSSKSIAGGSGITGRVEMSNPLPADAAIKVTSSDLSLARISPDTVRIPAGQASSAYFKVITSRVTRNTSITITASAGNFRISQLLELTVQIDSINIVPSVIRGGQGAIGTLVLSGSPPSGAKALLTSSNPQIVRFGAGPIASAQQSATVNLNGLTSGFSIATGTVTQNTTVTVSATYNGVTVTKNIAVIKEPGSP